jgi:hypothetical protein
MNNKNMFVDTISAINVNNGIVKMNLVAQSSEQPITLIDKRIAILKAR